MLVNKKGVAASTSLFFVNLLNKHLPEQIERLEVYFLRGEGSMEERLFEFSFPAPVLLGRKCIFKVR